MMEGEHTPYIVYSNRIGSFILIDASTLRLKFCSRRSKIVCHLNCGNAGMSFHITSVIVTLYVQRLHSAKLDWHDDATAVELHKHLQEAQCASTEAPPRLVRRSANSDHFNVQRDRRHLLIHMGASHTSTKQVSEPWYFV